MGAFKKPEQTRLLNEFFTTMAQDETLKYCAICLRTEKERRLVNNTALRVFTASAAIKREWKNKFICYMCHRQALRAIMFIRGVSFAGSVDVLFTDLLYLKKLNEDILQTNVFKSLLQKKGMEGLRCSPELYEIELRCIRRSNTYKCRRTKVTGVGTGRPDPDILSSANLYLVHEDSDDEPLSTEDDLPSTSASKTSNTASNTSTTASETSPPASNTNTTASETSITASNTNTTASETSITASNTNTTASETSITASNTNTTASETSITASNTNTTASETSITASQTTTTSKKTTGSKRKKSFSKHDSVVPTSSETSERAPSPDKNLTDSEMYGLSSSLKPGLSKHLNEVFGCCEGPRWTRRRLPITAAELKAVSASGVNLYEIYHGRSNDEVINSTVQRLSSGETRSARGARRKSSLNEAGSTRTGTLGQSRVSGPVLADDTNDQSSRVEKGGTAQVEQRLSSGETRSARGTRRKSSLNEAGSTRTGSLRQSRDSAAVLADDANEALSSRVEKGGTAQVEERLSSGETRSTRGARRKSSLNEAGSTRTGFLGQSRDSDAVLVTANEAQSSRVEKGGTAQSSEARSGRANGVGRNQSPVAGPSWAFDAGPSRSPVAGPSWASDAGPRLSPVAGPSWASDFGSRLTSGVDPRQSPVAGPSWAYDAGPSRASDDKFSEKRMDEAVKETDCKGKHKNLAGKPKGYGVKRTAHAEKRTDHLGKQADHVGKCTGSEAGRSQSPVAGPSWASDAGPSWASETGPSRRSEAGPSRSPVAGPSRASDAGPSRSPAAGPSWASDAGPSRSPVAGPSWTSDAGPSRSPVAGPSWASDVGPSWASEASTSQSPVAGPSCSYEAGPGRASEDRSSQKSTDEVRKRTEHAGKETDHKGKQTDHKRKHTDHKGKSTDHGGKRTDHGGKRTTHAGTRTDDVGKRTDEAEKRKDEAGKHTDDVGKRTDEAGKHTDEAGKHSDRAGKRTDHKGKSTDHGGKRTDHGGKRTNNAEKRTDHGGNCTDDAGKRTDEAGKHWDRAGKCTEQAGKRTDEAGKRTDEAGKHSDRRTDETGKHSERAGKCTEHAGKRTEQAGKRTEPTSSLANLESTSRMSRVGAVNNIVIPLQPQNETMVIPDGEEEDPIEIMIAKLVGADVAPDPILTSTARTSQAKEPNRAEQNSPNTTQKQILLNTIYSVPENQHALNSYSAIINTDNTPNSTTTSSPLTLKSSQSDPSGLTWKTNLDRPCRKRGTDDVSMTATKNKRTALHDRGSGSVDFVPHIPAGVITYTGSAASQHASHVLRTQTPHILNSPQTQQPNPPNLPTTMRTQTPNILNSPQTQQPNPPNLPTTMRTQTPHILNSPQTQQPNPSNRPTTMRTQTPHILNSPQLGAGPSSLQMPPPATTYVIKSPPHARMQEPPRNYPGVGNIVTNPQYSSPRHPRPYTNLTNEQIRNMVRNPPPDVSGAYRNTQHFSPRHRQPIPQMTPTTAQMRYVLRTPPAGGGVIHARPQAAVGLNPGPYGPRMGRSAYGPPRRPRYVGRNQGQPAIQDAIRKYTFFNDDSKDV
ncbi:hypothetical protein PYW08_012091 [Mythimna loreyi]|uniref:Uncharacterized protein n=1 Tax=Mythimna loreyi TaxID=667449 RepID=A0ACC2PZG3_9NEOP|nr:hypothetical protein PYW08_012091 [Mythimna loreyi]